jgi:hypothetical protein
MNENSKDEDQENEPPFAASPDTHATDCHKIKEYADYKRNGFYWVKTKCMPKPERVYCDFKDNFPNFYVYKGWHADKIEELDGANS